jgi:hypothetical protein
MDQQEIEKYSSAYTLSDMEIFIFPELLYSLVLANIMSPVIWRWREEESFKKLEGKDTIKKLLRLRQFIMDNYDFNLDLETWGLTTKEREIKRFENILPREQLSQSNALFGYEGDKYYFDVDIRKHFGLDKYDSEIIPYWKTETVEAMNAFRRKSKYTTGAGECVSLSTLYAAAAFIVCGVPLEDIFIIQTPLHSQNFIDISDGILTNNRRLITKTMWFNGSEISDKAQRAIRNERVTIVSHNSGLIHCLYNDATIDRDNFERFKSRLASFLSTELTMQSCASFMRSWPKYQKYFQACKDCHGQAKYIKAEILFGYEHSSKYRIAEGSHNKLLEEANEEDFVTEPLPDRIRCDQLEEFLRKVKPNPGTPEGRQILIKNFAPYIPDVEQMISKLADFLHIDAKLPIGEKNYIKSLPIKISTESSREEIINYLKSIRSANPTADLAFYAYRDMESCDWQPFIKAAIERSPVSIDKYKSLFIEQIYQQLKAMPNESIYDDKRLAQPDEIANYNTGDGLEKAFLLANIIRHRSPEQKLKITVDNNRARLDAEMQFSFESSKELKKEVEF